MGPIVEESSRAEGPTNKRQCTQAIKWVRECPEERIAVSAWEHREGLQA